jgi:hypothetical protein
MDTAAEDPAAVGWRNPTVSIELDWAAPIIPGHSAMGLTLGTPRRAVLRALHSYLLVREAWWVSQLRAIVPSAWRPGSNSVVFPNAPKLWVDSSENAVVYLRATEIKPCNHAWQNRLARLVFKADRLEGIIVDSLRGDESLSYRGLLFGKAGLNSPVADLLEFCDLEYDEAEEWFYPTDTVTGLPIEGLLVAGQGAQDLTEYPTQRITFIRVFAARGRK